jgi:hypothetical protein
LQAVPAYLELHGVDPSEILLGDFMSDEASGPEGGELEESGSEEESFNDWKVCIMEIGDLRGDPGSTSVLEVVKPEWRNKKVSVLRHRIYDCFTH